MNNEIKTNKSKYLKIDLNHQNSKQNQFASRTQYNTWQSPECKVEVLEFKVQVLECKVQVLEWKVQVLECKAQVLKSKVLILEREGLHVSPEAEGLVVIRGDVDAETTR